MDVAPVFSSSGACRERAHAWARGGCKRDGALGERSGNRVRGCCSRHLFSIAVVVCLGNL